MTVQAGFGYRVTSNTIYWTDITEFADLVSGISITPGASDEVSDIQAATASLTLDNSDGRFTAGLGTSPYSPNVVKNCPLRILVTATAKNFITNPTFDVDDTDWEYGSVDPASVVGDATHVQAGAYAALITWSTSGTGGIYQTIVYGLTIGQRYTASGYVWVPASGQPVRLQINDGLATGTASSTTGAFQRITVTWTATSASHAVQITTTASPPAAGKTVWLDSVQVEEGTSATTFDSAGAVVSGRHYGMVNEWPTRWKGLYATATITATDTFKWLTRQPALQPMLVEEILQLGPISYYTLAEPADSTTVGDLSGQVTTTLSITQAGAGGTLAFAGSTGPAGTGQSCPTFTPASASAGKYLTADLGGQFQIDSGATYIVVEAWFQTSTTDRVICSLKSTTGDYQITFALDSATGHLAITSVSPSTGSATVVFSTASLADGAWHQLVYNENGLNIYIDGVSYGPLSVASMHDLRLLAVGSSFGTRLWNGALSHVAVYTLQHSSTIGADAAAHYAAGSTGFTGETADVRVPRLASYVNFDYVNIYGTTFDPVASQGEGGSTALDAMKEIEATESGRLFAERDEYAIAFQSRDLRYNPTSAFSLVYADLETDDVGFEDDDQKIVNTVIASRPGGATQRFVDDASRAKFGPYQPPDLNLLKTTDLKVSDAANWMISRYADPPPELREISIDAYSMPMATYQALLAANISTTFTVTGLPAQALSSTATCTVEGYVETIRQSSHLLAFHCSRAYTDSVWVLDDPTYSVLGSTTRLAY